MNPDATGILSIQSRGTSLAFVSMAIWMAAAVNIGLLGIWLALGGAAVTLGLAILLFGRPASTTLLHPTPKLLLLGVATGGLMVMATYLLYPWLTHLLPCVATDTAQLYAAFRAPSLVLASMALVPVILGEELVWRGVVQSALVERLGAWKGVSLAAGMYALVQVPLGSPMLVVVAFFCGLAWGILRATTASLVPTLVAHLLWDGLVLLWFPLDLSLR